MAHLPKKIRTSNTLSSTGWGLSIAATGGNTTLWSAGTPKYDYNDPTGSPPGCSAGTDSDTYAGQLSLDPSVSTVTPQSGCNNTGISKGSSSAFSEGSIDSITLLSASAASARGCYWDLTDIGAGQKIPAGQASSSYSINLTLTVVAN